MRSAAFWLFASMASLVLLNGGASAQEGYSPITGWDHQLFPSYLVATATIRLPESDDVDLDEEAETVVLGDPQGVLGIEIEAPEDETEVSVTISGSEILEETTFETTLDSAGVTYRIFPRMRYKYGTLAKNKQTRPVHVTYSVTIDGEEEEDHTEILTLRSINDCPFAIIDADDEFSDISFMFAAYVNEQHPFVDKLLREALDEGVVDSFTGYQSGDPAEVYRQVYAVWNALSDRDVRYSNITTSVASTDAVYSQHVRMIDESLNNGQANCVDGSVLLASVLRKIDIEPVLVYVPGHCYLAFYLDAEQTQLVGLETTLIGSVADDSTRELPEVGCVVDKDWKGTNSWGTFCEAVEMGNADLAANKEIFGGDDPDYQLVSIAAARQIGILPIAFDSNDQFQGVEYEDEEAVDDEE